MREEPAEEGRQVSYRWLKNVIWLLLGAFAVWLVARLKLTTVLFFLAIFFAYLLHPLVRMLSEVKIPFLKGRLSWQVSTFVVYVVIAGFITVSGVLIVPATFEQVEVIIREIPSMIESANRSFVILQDRYNSYEIPPVIRERINQSTIAFTTQMGSYLENSFAAFGNFLLQFFSWLLYVIVMLILAFLMLLEVDRIGKNFYFYVPPSYHARVKALVNEVNGIFGNYMRGNFICVFANGILTYFLLVAGVLVMHLVLPGARESFPFYKYALVASLFAGIMFPIPYVAHGLSMLLGAILAYMQTQSLLYGFFIGFVIFIAFQIVDFIVRPKIMGDALGVSTIFVFFAAISGGEIFGTIGLFMGIPLSLIMISLFRFVYYNFLTLPRADSSQPGTPCPVPPADGEALAGES